MPVEVEVRGLDELRRRFRRFPRIYRREVRTTLRAGLGVLQENVPPYPPKPEGSTYIRTGTLGRTLGTNIGTPLRVLFVMGTLTQKPEIYEVRRHGPKEDIAEFGTRLEYAPYVIGEAEQAKQNADAGWWTIKAIAKASQDKIERLFKDMAKDLARFLEGKGLL